VIVYADFECHFCRLEHTRMAGRDVRLVFRHFPVKSKHPRAWPSACAAEAAALQGAFWEMHDALFSDQGRLEDPHLWARAERLGLDLGRFDADRRSDAVRERVERDFKTGLRAGVMATPAYLVDGELRREL
jgi:protein-disulfide isomerase